MLDLISRLPSTSRSKSQSRSSRPSNRQDDNQTTTGSTGSTGSTTTKKTKTNTDDDESKQESSTRHRGRSRSRLPSRGKLRKPSLSLSLMSRASSRLSLPSVERHADDPSKAKTKTTTATRRYSMRSTSASSSRLSGRRTMANNSSHDNESMSHSDNPHSDDGLVRCRSMNLRYRSPYEINTLPSTELERKGNLNSNAAADASANKQPDAPSPKSGKRHSSRSRERQYNQSLDRQRDFRRRHQPQHRRNSRRPRESSRQRKSNTANDERSPPRRRSSSNVALAPGTPGLQPRQQQRHRSRSESEPPIRSPSRRRSLSHGERGTSRRRRPSRGALSPQRKSSSFFQRSRNGGPPNPSKLIRSHNNGSVSFSEWESSKRSTVGKSRRRPSQLKTDDDSHHGRGESNDDRLPESMSKLSSYNDFLISPGAYETILKKNINDDDDDDESGKKCPDAARGSRHGENDDDPLLENSPKLSYCGDTHSPQARAKTDYDHDYDGPRHPGVDRGSPQGENDDGRLPEKFSKTGSHDNIHSPNANANPDCDGDVDENEKRCIVSGIRLHHGENEDDQLLDNTMQMSSFNGIYSHQTMTKPKSPTTIDDHDDEDHEIMYSKSSSFYDDIHSEQSKLRQEGKNSFSSLRRLSTSLRGIRAGIDEYEGGASRNVSRSKKYRRRKELSKSLNEWASRQGNPFDSSHDEGGNCCGQTSNSGWATGNNVHVDSSAFVPLSEDAETVDGSVCVQSVTHLINRSHQPMAKSQSKSWNTNMDNDTASDLNPLSRSLPYVPRLSTAPSVSPLTALNTDGGVSSKASREKGRKVVDALRAAGVDPETSLWMVKNLQRNDEVMGEEEINLAECNVSDKDEEKEEHEALQQMVQSSLQWSNTGPEKDEEATGFMESYISDEEKEEKEHEALQQMVKSYLQSNETDEAGAFVELSIRNKLEYHRNVVENHGSDNRGVNSFDLFDKDGLHHIVNTMIEDGEEDIFLEGKIVKDSSENISTNIRDANEIGEYIVVDDGEDSIMEMGCRPIHLPPILSQGGKANSLSRKFLHAELKDGDEGEASLVSAAEVTSTIMYPNPTKKGSDSLSHGLSSTIIHAELDLGDEVRVTAVESLDSLRDHSISTKTGSDFLLRRLSSNYGHGEPKHEVEEVTKVLEEVQELAVGELPDSIICHPIPAKKGSSSQFPFPHPPFRRSCHGDIGGDSKTEPEKCMEDDGIASKSSATKEPFIPKCMDNTTLTPDTEPTATSTASPQSTEAIIILNEGDCESTSSFSDCFKKTKRSGDKKSGIGKYKNENKSTDLLPRIDNGNKSGPVEVLPKDRKSGINLCSVPELSFDGCSTTPFEQRERGMLNQTGKTHPRRERLTLNRSHTNPGPSSTSKGKKERDRRQNKHQANSTRRKKQPRRKDVRAASTFKANNNGKSPNEKSVPKAIEIQVVHEESPTSTLDPETKSLHYLPPSGSKPPLRTHPLTRSNLESLPKAPPPPPLYLRKDKGSSSSEPIKKIDQKQHRPPPPLLCPLGAPHPSNISNRPTTRQGGCHKIDEPSNDISATAKSSSHNSEYPSSITLRPPPPRKKTSERISVSVAAGTECASTKDDVTTYTNYSSSVFAASLGSTSACRSNYSSIMSTTIGVATNRKKHERQSRGLGGSSRRIKASAPSIHQEKKS